MPSFIYHCCSPGRSPGVLLFGFLFQRLVKIQTSLKIRKVLLQLVSMSKNLSQIHSDSIKPIIPFRV